MIAFLGALLKCFDKFYSIGLLLKADHHKDGIYKVQTFSQITMKLFVFYLKEKKERCAWMFLKNHLWTNIQNFYTGGSDDFTVALPCFRVKQNR